MHVYVIFFLNHAITIVFLFCSFIRMFVRKWIAVPLRAKKEVEEQPISGQKRVCVLECRCTTRSQNNAKNDRQEDCGAMTRCQEHTRDKKTPCTYGTTLEGPYTGRQTETAGKRAPYAERRASDPQGAVAP